MEHFGSAETALVQASRNGKAARVEELPDATSGANPARPPNIGLQRMGWISGFEMPRYRSPTAEAWVVGRQVQQIIILTGALYTRHFHQIVHSGCAMRKEAHDAIHIIDTFLQPVLQHLHDNPDLPFVMTEQDEKALQTQGAQYQAHLEVVYQQFSAYLMSDAVSLYLDRCWPTSIDVKGQEHEPVLLQIDITPYGPFVALWVYSEGAQAILPTIQRCLEACELFILTEAEIDELHTSGRYYDLF